MFVVENDISSEENLDNIDPIDSSDDLDVSKDSAKKNDSENIPNISDLGNWYTLRVVSGKEKFVNKLLLLVFKE